MRNDRSHWLGKYRDLLLAIGLFLVLDIGVLAVNVVISRQIEVDAERINLAGDLRVDTQQLTKALLTLNFELAGADPIQTSMAQLRQSHASFNRALARLDDLAGKDTQLPLLDNAASRTLADEMRQRLARLWHPLDRDVGAIIESDLPTAEVAGIAVTRAVAVNLRLFQEADDLSAHLESTAREKAVRMRQIQVGAIALATLNFIFIVFKFLRRLRQSDRRAEAAREETERILGSVREGLFLMHRDGRIGAQRSASLDRLLGCPVREGDSAFALLQSLFSPADAAAAQQFIQVLFNGRVKPKLLERLNPLHEIEVPGSGSERSGSRYLTIEFTQVRSADEVEALLVTVFDVTQKVTLERALAGAQAKVQNDVELLLGVLDHAPATVRGFIGSAVGKLSEINIALETVRPTDSDYRTLVNDVALTVHAIKGEAAALGLGTVERQAHEFEDLIADLRGRRDLSGDDLIPVAVQMNALNEQIKRVEHLVERVARYGGGAVAAETAPDCQLQPILAQVERLAQRVAEDLDKQVRVEVVAPRFTILPAPVAGLLRETLPQLVRNAVVHGIEPTAERLESGKPAQGLLRVEVRIGECGELSIGLRDDGRGIAPDKLRRQLVERGLRSEAQAAGLRDDEVVALLFEPGVSSRETVDRHAGRGDGLALVKAAVHRFGGRLRLSTVPASHTHFLLQLKAHAWITA